jgi:hypothetical protein
MRRRNAFLAAESRANPGDPGRKMPTLPGIEAIDEHASSGLQVAARQLGSESHWHEPRPGALFLT